MQKNIKLFVDGQEVRGVESAEIKMDQQHQDIGYENSIARVAVEPPQYIIDVKISGAQRGYDWNNAWCNEVSRTGRIPKENVVNAKDLRLQAKKMLEEAALLESRPVDDFEVGAVLVFDKQYYSDGQVYTYTAIKTNRAVNEWHVSSMKYMSYISWNDVLDFAEKDGGTVNGIYLVTELKEVKYK